MRIVSYESFKKIYEAMPYEPEFCINFEDKNAEYMIIKYEDGPTFQRCGAKDGSGEVKFNSLDDLYNAVTIDNILLKRDWGKITSLYENGYGTLDECCYIYKIDIDEYKDE